MQDLIARAESIARRLKDRGETVVVAESSTGGLISAALLGCRARPPTSSAAPSSTPRLPGERCWICRISPRWACAPRPSPMRCCWRKPRGNASPRAGRWRRAEPPGGAAIATAIQPATPASPWPVRSSARPRSRPAAPTASPTCKPSAPPHSTCCWLRWPVSLRRRPDGTPVRQTAGKVTAKQLPCAVS